MKPLLVINTKAYESATGVKALKLAEICESIANELNVAIMLAVQPSDVFLVASQVSIPILSQHCDANYGAFTGSVTAKSLLDNCAYGTMLNHSEHRVNEETIRKVIEECKKLKLKVLLCVASLEEARKYKDLKPDYMAFEEPSLIGGNLSITQALPKSVEGFARLCRNAGISPLCGAGIKRGEDFLAAIELGCDGVLVASAVAKAANQREAILELCSKVVEKR